jgi:tetratricopeptide (TPR) repeat protein
MLARMLATGGRTREAEELVHELAELVRQQTGPESRRTVAGQIGGYGSWLLQKNSRKDAAGILRLAITVDPDNANLRNNLAWALASFPDSPAYEPAEALDVARKAVALSPKSAFLWNTLGVAAYRTGDWKTASEALEKSMSLNQGGDANDWFFLAMTRWRQNNKTEARKWFDQAVAWTKNKKPDDPELQYFQAEAASVLEGKTTPGESKPAVKHP